ncbi:MAG: hypothetical protein R3C61_11665 [Bacteroidia bacterium]
MAGFVACLRQAHPERNNIDIIRAVRLSGDQAGLPDEEFGYGIPNAAFADSLLTHVADLTAVKIETKEKPVRGQKPQPKPPVITDVASGESIVFTSRPKTELVVTDSEVRISTGAAGAMITGFSVYKGKQKLTFSGTEIQSGENSVIINKKYLLKGKYYLDIVTPQFEEKIPFEVR